MVTIILVAGGKGIDVGVVEQGLVAVSPGEFLKIKVNTIRSIISVFKTVYLLDLKIY